MNKSGKEWNGEETEYLKNNYYDYSLDTLSKNINRSKTAILSKARKLKLKKRKNFKTKYERKNLEKVVRDSNTLTDCLNNMGLRCAGGNYMTLNKYIDEYGISTDHFISDEQRLKGAIAYIKKTKIPTNDILVSGSSYNRTNLKKRLVDEGLLEYNCEKCDNGGKWMGHNLSLHLDHINGVHNDNRLENLRFLCPNCHSQTDTYAGKATRKERPPKGEKTKKHNLKRRVVERPAHDELVKEVKFHGYSATGRKYGVSDNAIRKWVKNYEKNGY